jgi:polyhydroxyalkanoate synthesis regulator phasin
MRAEQERAWRERLQKANEDVGKTQERIDALQRALNDLSQNLYGATRTQQLQQMEQAQTQLGQLKQQVADLQEEGRRNGWR